MHFRHRLPIIALCKTYLAISAPAFYAAIVCLNGRRSLR